MKPYIGFTGPTEVGEVDAAVRVMNSYPDGFGPYQMMNGVLANYTTLHGKVSPHVPKRYPSVSVASKLFTKSPDVLDLYHYNTPNTEFEPELEQLIKYGGPNLDGFQINKRWPKPSELYKFREKGHQHVMVLQIGRGAFEAIDNDPVKLTDKIEAEYLDLVDFVLLDPSGGTGHDMDIKKTRSYLSEIYMRRLQDKLMIGIAGGLSAYNLGRIDTLIAEFALLSIDIEGKIRDKKTDEFYITELVKYLRAAYQHLVVPLTKAVA